METKPAKTAKSNYWFILAFLLIAVIALIIFQSEVKEKKKSSKFSSRSNWNGNDYKRRKNNLPDLEDQEDNDENEEEDNGKDYDYELFRQKGYFDRDIKELKSWGFEAGEVPDLLAEKRRGVVNTLSVDTEEKGFCSELVILLKESPHTMTIDNLDDILKINQSQGFAESTRNNNSQVIKFAIRKIIQQGHKWEHDVYVLKVNSAATISGTSAGSGVYLALLSARFPNCALSKKLAITGVLDTEKKSTSVPIATNPKKYHWQGDHCVKCGKYS
ncbi:MAG: hypothetical protein MRERV_2c025 [Mycoplasmataceae bacterium RV_VA103A]|nr:MAG: hypothetical protein MRERV_2c025 [Mycoplasmataceae bacterium RV_VA103A]